MRRLVALLALTTLGACNFTPRYVPPPLPTPSSWPVGAAYPPATQEAALPAVTYRELFRDPRLQAIIAQALANNRDLRLAAANIAAARAQYHIQRAELFPEIDAGASYRHSYTGGGTPPAGSAETPAASGDNYSVNGQIAAYEVDLFGRVRSLTNEAKERYFEQGAAARATRLTLIGDIATAWLTYAADRSALTIAQQTAASAQRSVGLTQDRYRAGVSAQTDIDQANTVLQGAQADIASETTLVAQDLNALQLLVGAPIDPRLLPASIEQAAPTIAAPPAGVSSTVLLGRPDVVEAEDELRATNAGIGVARAELFPVISLTGVSGFASSALASLFTGGAFNWSVGANAAYPIFRAGAGIANVRLSKAQRDAALATYEKTIQTAFQEVSDALARRGTIDAQVRAVSATVASAQNDYALSSLRYGRGVDTYLQTLDAQRTLYTARQTLAALQLIKAANLVTLYRTLGNDPSLADEITRHT